METKNERTKSIKERSLCLLLFPIFSYTPYILPSPFLYKPSSLSFLIIHLFPPTLFLPFHTTIFPFTPCHRLIHPFPLPLSFSKHLLPFPFSNIPSLFLLPFQNPLLPLLLIHPSILPSLSFFFQTIYFILPSPYSLLHFSHHLFKLPSFLSSNTLHLPLSPYLSKLSSSLSPHFIHFILSFTLLIFPNHLLPYPFSSNATSLFPSSFLINPSASLSFIL